MSINLSDYYHNKFRNALKNIKCAEGSQVTNPDDIWFSKEAWLEALRKMRDKEERACLIFSMFITVASDQTMYTYYSGLYEEFRTLTRYPKFGWYGLGPHNENPLLLIQYPVEEGVVDWAILEDYFKPAAQLFAHEVKAFFTNHMSQIDPNQFVSKFVEDEHVAYVLDGSDKLYSFVNSLGRETAGWMNNTNT